MANNISKFKLLSTVGYKNSTEQYPDVCKSLYGTPGTLWLWCLIFNKHDQLFPWGISMSKLHYESARLWSVWTSEGFLIYSAVLRLTPEVKKTGWKFKSWYLWSPKAASVNSGQDAVGKAPVFQTRSRMTAKAHSSRSVLIKENHKSVTLLTPGSVCIPPLQWR